MKYLIRRTACSLRDNPEVEKAYPIQFHKLYKTARLECPDYMYRVCDNIRKEGNLWVGDEKETEEGWAIDINSLKELNALVKETGSPIIIHSIENVEGMPELEVYDDWRE